MEVIRTVHKNAPDPIAHIVTRWGSDEFSRGCWTYPKKGCRGKLDIAEARHPVGALFFAGVHTATVSTGNAHSAFRSGARAADEVLSHLKLREQSPSPSPSSES